MKYWHRICRRKFAKKSRSWGTRICPKFRFRNARPKIRQKSRTPFFGYNFYFFSRKVRRTRLVFTSPEKIRKILAGLFATAHPPIWATDQHQSFALSVKFCKIWTKIRKKQKTRTVEFTNILTVIRQTFWAIVQRACYDAKKFTIYSIWGWKYYFSTEMINENNENSFRKSKKGVGVIVQPFFLCPATTPRALKVVTPPYL